jgi:recombination protein RecR
VYPKSIQRLIAAFARFPTIGPRVAARFVFYVMKASDSEVEELVQAIGELRQRIKLCSFCFNPYQVEGGALCEICADSGRDRSLLCIVEKESDLEALEKTRQYRGRYFLLGGVQDILKKEGILNVQVAELKERLSEEIKEVIIALNPTAEGESATLYIERIIKPLGVQVTRIGRGLPMGGELEYADDETIRSALEGRK